MGSNILEPAEKRDTAARPDPEIPHETLITPSSGWRLPNLAELWRFSDLIYFLAWRDVKVRYRQAALGVAWAVLQPTLMMVVLASVFGGLGGLNSGSTPYPVFLLAGLLPWTFFASAVTGAAGSVVMSEALIKKVYFPRLAIPISAICVALVDFLIAMSVLAVMMIWYQVPTGLSLIYLPLVIVVLLLAGLGVGSLIAALNVAYRDFRFIVGFLVQLWMFATPAIYFNYMSPMQSSTDAITIAQQESNTNTMAQDSNNAPTIWSQSTRWIVRLNPLDGLIHTFRASVFGNQIPWSQFGYSICVTLLAGLAAMLYFAHVEDDFADIV